MAPDRKAEGVVGTTLTVSVLRCGREMEIPPHYSFQNVPATYIEMVRSPGVGNSGRKLLPHSDVREGRALGDPTIHTLTTQRQRKKTTKTTMRIGTWNVRTLNKEGKLENLILELERNNIDIAGLGEVRRKGQGEIDCEGYKLYYCGGEKAQNGVGIIVNNSMVKNVLKIFPVSDRLIAMTIQAEPVNILIIQVYMPTSAHEDEEIDLIYEQINEIIRKEGKGKVNAIILGDWNSVVGEGRDRNIVGPYGLGKRNERGEMLVDFCFENKLVITNTWFKKHKRKLFTWKMQADRGRFQIDYILVKERFRNSVKDVRIIPSADIDSDHNLLVASISTRLKRIKTQGRKKSKWDLEQMNNKASQVTQALEEKISGIIGKDVNLEQEWDEIKKCVKDTLINEVGRQRKRAKKPWITQEMINKMEERRKWKNVNSEAGRQMYRKLNNQLRRITDEAKLNYLENKCDEITTLERIGRYDLMYAKAKEFDENKSRNIRNKEFENELGIMVNDPTEVKIVWENYIQELYDKPHRPKEIALEKENEIDIDSIGPNILKCEVRKAIQDMKRGKATGDDEIPVDILKLMGESGIDALTKLINRIYDSGEWPNDFLEVTMIPLPKKPNAKKCSDHRTISLISHVSKIVARILTKRIEKRAEDILSEDQFGFRKGRGTRDAIGAVRILAERAMEVNTEVCVCFIDWQKAFDRVNWEKLMEILNRIGIDWKDRRLITSLYMGQKVKVRLENGDTDSVQIGRGVRQGCCLSPALFNIYGESLANEALENRGNLKVGGEVIKTIKYADDLAVMAHDESELQRMIDNLVNTGKAYGMEINSAKSMVMRIAKENKSLNVAVNGHMLEQVDTFKYLGSTVTCDAGCTKEIKIRIALGKVAFNKKRELLTSKINLQLKKKFVKCYVWSIALYGSETWTLREKERKYLEAFEMWCWRKMEKIDWRDHITNEEVLAKVQENRSILKVIKQRKANWIGHILRGEGLLRDITEGKIAGKRGRGRKRIQLLDDLKEQKTYFDLKTRAQNRTSWRQSYKVNKK